MTKRVSQTTAVNGPRCIIADGRTINRCIDDPDHKTCDIGRAWPWAHGPIPMDCQLPRATEED